MFFVVDREPVRQVELKILNSLRGFFTKTSLLALAGVDSLVFVWQKTKVRTRSHSVAVREFLLTAGQSSLLRTVSVTVLWKLGSYGLRPQYCLSS